MTDIKLSEKHGVNPSMIICIFCGECKAIALVGRLPGDAEAPRKFVNDYDPCDKCKESMDKGITMIGVIEEDFSKGKFPPISEVNGKKLWPTGSFVVVTEDGFKDIFHSAPPEIIADTIKYRKIFVPHEHLLHFQKQEQEQAPAQSLSEGEGGEIKDTEPPTT